MGKGSESHGFEPEKPGADKKSHRAFQQVVRWMWEKWIHLAQQGEEKVDTCMPAHVSKMLEPCPMCMDKAGECTAMTELAARGPVVALPAPAETAASQGNPRLQAGAAENPKGSDSSIPRPKAKQRLDRRDRAVPLPKSSAGGRPVTAASRGSAVGPSSGAGHGAPQSTRSSARMPASRASKRPASSLSSSSSGSSSSSSSSSRPKAAPSARMLEP